MTRVINFELLFPVLVLILLSLTTLLSLSHDLFVNQLIFTLIGFFAFIIFSLLDYKRLKKFSLWIFAISVAALFVILFLGIEVRGATRWLDIIGFRFQLSEILKPFLLVSLAAFLSERKLYFSTFLLTLVLLGVVSLPIFLQPDLGNTLIYLLTCVFLLLFYGIPLSWFILPGGVLVIILPLLWHILRDYQKLRLVSFINPKTDPLGVSYNLIQAVIAVGGGGLIGRGLGHGTQSLLEFLPERHTDFIFATIAENFGFLGAVLLLSAFAFLLFKTYKIIIEAEDSFAALLGAGAFFLIAFQVFINIGGNIGILPITGVTLPLVSYGGSSLLSTFILLGILNSITRTFRKRPQILEIR